MLKLDSREPYVGFARINKTTPNNSNARACGNKMALNNITSKSLFHYGVLAAPVAFAGFPLYILAPDFYATHYGVSLSLLASLLFVVRLFDAIQDPLLGWLIDRFQRQLLPLVVIAASLLCLAVYGLFNITIFSPAIWFVICVICAVTAYSVLTIALGVHATLWITDAKEQTRLAGVREVFGLIGLVIAVSAPVVLEQWVNAKSVYLWYSVILFGLMFLGVANFSKVVNLKQASVLETPRSQSLWHVIAAWKALPRESVRLLLVYAISMLASSIPSVLVIFYVRDFLGAEHLTGFFLLLYFLSGAAAIPLWKMLSGWFGKYQAWCLANVIAVVGFVGAVFLNAGDFALFAVVCALSGMAFGADLILPPSILADHINTHNNRAYAASHYALLALIVKASLALASVLVLPVLDSVGFMPNAKNSELALSTLSLAYSAFPCLLKLTAAGMLYLFFISSLSGEKNENCENGDARRDVYDAE